MRLSEEQRAGVGLVRVAGEIDLATAPDLRRALVRAIDRSRAVEVDLREVTFIDLVGLRALDRAQRIAADSGCRLVLRRSRAVQRLERLVADCGPRVMGDSTHGGRLCRPRA